MAASSNDKSGCAIKIIVVGGGIGGLTQAIALQRKGYSVTIYERVSEMRPVGAGISVWSNGVKVLNALGVGQEIAEVGGWMESMSYRKFDDGETFCAFPLDPLYSRVKQRAYPVSRTQLQRMLLEGAGRENVHLSSRVSDYEILSDGVKVILEDGRTDTADFLVIADGTHSKLRNKICQQNITRRYAGYVNWNGPDIIDTECWQQFVGQGKRVSMMPLGDGGKLYVYFDASPERGEGIPIPTASGYKAELRSFFAGWHPVVQRLIDVFDETKIARAEIHDHDPLPTLVDPSGRAVLIGDAGHATAPDLGQGGCQAMEDAFVIAELLSKEVGQEKATTEALQRVVKQYQDLRGERVASLVLRARKRAGVTHALVSETVTQEWYNDLKKEDGTHIIDGMCKTIEDIPPALQAIAETLPEALPASKREAAKSSGASESVSKILPEALRGNLVSASA